MGCGLRSTATEGDSARFGAASAECYGEDGSFGATYSPCTRTEAGNLWAGSREGPLAMETWSAKTLSDAGPDSAALMEGDDGELLIATRRRN